MKTVTGRVNSAEPISLSKASSLLSGFVSSENDSSQDVSAYLRRASAAFTELRSVHREIRSKNPKSELEELGGAKGIDDSVDNETVTGEESVHCRKKKKSRENKEEDVDEKMNVKLEEERKEKKKKNRKSDGEIGSEESKCKKTRKSKGV